MAALSFILFSEGMDTMIAEIMPIIGSGIMLSTMGVLLTMVFTGFFTYTTSEILASLRVSLLMAWLMATTISPTNSATVFNILRPRRMELRSNL
jgi:NhaP-type Na+/H+ and K+/H+ antiporters with a unique C-terminal domain